MGEDNVYKDNMICTGFLEQSFSAKMGKTQVFWPLSSRGENKTKASPTRLKKETIVEVTLLIFSEVCCGSILDELIC